MKLLRFLSLILLFKIKNLYGFEEKNIKVDKFEKEIKISVNDYEKSINSVKNFVKDLKIKNSRYSVYYNVNVSDFLNDVSMLLFNEGVRDIKYEATNIESNDYDIRLIAAYQEVREINCAPSKMSSNEYKLGCSVEYNRKVSLLNPLRFY